MALGKFTHAEGTCTMAYGRGAHAEGCCNEAIGEYSHTEGYNTKALSNYQHVQGKYNIEDSENKYAHIVGNGYEDAIGQLILSNAHTLDWQGNAWFAGEVTASNGRLISEDEARALIPEVDSSEEWYIISGDFSFGDEEQFITVD